MGEIFKCHTLQIPMAVLFKASSVFINISFVTYDKKEREPEAKYILARTELDFIGQLFSVNSIPSDC